MGIILLNKNVKLTSWAAATWHLETSGATVDQYIEALLSVIAAAADGGDDAVRSHDDATMTLRYCLDSDTIS